MNTALDQIFNEPGGLFRVGEPLCTTTLSPDLAQFYLQSPAAGHDRLSQLQGGFQIMLVLSQGMSSLMVRSPSRIHLVTLLATWMMSEYMKVGKDMGEVYTLKVLLLRTAFSIRASISGSSLKLNTLKENIVGKLGVVSLGFSSTRGIIGSITI